MNSTNKPHHGIINNGVLTWVNEPGDKEPLSLTTNPIYEPWYYTAFKDWLKAREAFAAVNKR